jgi:hypothetical protein
MRAENDPDPRNVFPTWDMFRAVAASIKGFRQLAASSCDLSVFQSMDARVYSRLPSPMLAA